MSRRSSSPPGYRVAENPRESCKTCAYFARGNWCEMFSVAVKAEKTCDKWTATRSEVPMPETRRTVSTSEREKLASKGQAMPDGSYPIANVSDLKNAIQAIGRAKNPSAVRAHIKRRAKALGRTDLIPEGWRSAMPNTKGRFDEIRDSDSDSDGDRDSADDIAGEAGVEPAIGAGVCNTCEGTGETDFGMCQDCQGTGVPKGEALMAGQQSFNSAAKRLEGTVERRRASDGLEIRSTSDGGLRFSGYASVTETPYSVGGFEETFARGAFKRTLSEQPDVSLLINHEGLPLARTTSGTLSLSEDARGLKVQADLDPSDPDVQSLVPKMKRGDLTEMSFAFRATDDEWSERDTKRLVRSATIHRGDVSIVTVGANSSATAGIRAMVEDFEQRAGKRNSGADREEIKAAIDKLQKLLAPEDEAADAAQQADLEGALKISVMRSELDLARAKRARRRVHA